MDPVLHAELLVRLFVLGLGANISSAPRSERYDWASRLIEFYLDPSLDRESVDSLAEDFSDLIDRLKPVLQVSRGPDNSVSFFLSPFLSSPQEHRDLERDAGYLARKRDRLYREWQRIDAEFRASLLPDLAPGGELVAREHVRGTAFNWPSILAGPRAYALDSTIDCVDQETLRRLSTRETGA